MLHTNAIRYWSINKYVYSKRFDLIVNYCTDLNICLFWSKISDISPKSRTLRFCWQIFDNEFIKSRLISVCEFVTYK